MQKRYELFLSERDLHAKNRVGFFSKEALVEYAMKNRIPTNAWVVESGLLGGAYPAANLRFLVPHLVSPAQTSHATPSASHQGFASPDKILTELRAIREQTAKVKWAVRGVGMMIALLLLFGISITSN